MDRDISFKLDEYGYVEYIIKVGGGEVCRYYGKNWEESLAFDIENLMQGGLEVWY